MQLIPEVPIDRIVHWVSTLVRIPSVNPAQAGARSGEPGEGTLAAFLAQCFESFGADVVREDVYPGRPNVYAMWRGECEAWRAVDVHMDTVGVEDMSRDPYGGTLVDERIHGRGAVDTKATLGIVLALVEQLAEASIRPRIGLLIAATVDEEVTFGGAPAFARWVRKNRMAVNQIIVAEPTSCAPVYGHKGALRLEFTVVGRSAHSSIPGRGQNAISAAASIVSALDHEQAQLSARQPGPLGPPSIAVTMINGGRGLNVIPDECSLCIDRRITDGEIVRRVKDDLIAFVRHHSKLSVHVCTLLELNAFYQSPQSRWVRQLAEWSGQKPTIAHYGSNACAYAGVAKECIVMGPGSIEQAHAADEWVTIAELSRMSDVYRQWLMSAN